MKTEFHEDKVFTAKLLALPNSSIEDPVGSLYEDIYVVPVQLSNGIIENHLIRSNKFYIRQTEIDRNLGLVDVDYMIDPSTLVDVTGDDYIVCGIDISDNYDVRYSNGEYVCLK